MLIVKRIISLFNKKIPPLEIKILVITLTILWVLMTALRLFFSLISPKPPSTVNSELVIFNKLLYVNFIDEKPDKFMKTFIRQINSSTIEIFKEKAKENPKNREINVQLLILKSMEEGNQKEQEEQDEKDTNGKGDSIKEKSEDSGKDEKEDTNSGIKEIYEKLNLDPSKDQGLMSILNSIYLPGKKEKITTAEKQKLQNAIKTNLKGWFRDYSLYRLYEMTGSIEGKARIRKEAREKFHSLLFGYAVLSFMFLGGLIGLPLLLLGFPMLTFYLYPDRTLKAKGVKNPDTPRFDKMLLWKAWLIFLVWEIMRVFTTIFSSIIFIQSKSIPLPTMFFTYTIIYSLTIFLVFFIFRLGDEKLNLSAIGLQAKNIWGRLSDILTGLGGYCVTVPLVIGGALFYKTIFGIYPKSSSPVFDIFNMLKSPLDIIMLFLLVGVLGPIFEEILFRGVLYTSLRKYIPAYVAIPAISFLFAFIHFDPGVIISLFIVGFVLNTLYERTGSLVPSIVTHMLWNSMTFFMYFTLMR